MLEIPRNPIVYGVCDEGGLELGDDQVPKMSVTNCLKRIGSNPITYDRGRERKLIEPQEEKDRREE